jgi:D-serine deaminase-like pyridoxal phosphate-dependent protein
VTGLEGLDRALAAEQLERVDASLKGLGPALFGRSLQEVAEARPSLFAGTFVPPMMVLRDAALRGNVATMAAFARDAGIELAPHGKTTLAPALFRRQLAAGAWGISVGTPSQVMLARAFAVPRVFLANELVDAAAIAWVLAELERDPEFEFLVYVDSVEGARLLGDGLTARGAGAGAPAGLGVLVEMGVPGGRTGCRTVREALAVARAARDAGVPLVGVAGYEGGIGHEITPTVLADVRAFLERMREAAVALADGGLLVDGASPILTAGGSVFFDEVVATLLPDLPGGRTPRVVIRPGAYVSHDEGHYEELSPFTRPGADPRRHLEPALEAWGQLVSVPEPGLALANIGRRDVSFDLGLPMPRRIRRPSTGQWLDAGAARVTQLNDQHAFVALPAGLDARPGDWMSFGISHPCTAFDKWHLLPVVDEDEHVVELVRTYF